MPFTIPEITINDLKKNSLAVLALLLIAAVVFYVNRDTNNCDQILAENKQLRVENRQLLRDKDSVNSILLNIIVKASDITKEDNKQKNEYLRLRDSVNRSKLEKPTKELLKEINKIK